MSNLKKIKLVAVITAIFRNVAQNRTNTSYPSDLPRTASFVTTFDISQRKPIAPTQHLSLWRADPFRGPNNNGSIGRSGAASLTNKPPPSHSHHPFCRPIIAPRSRCAIRKATARELCRSLRATIATLRCHRRLAARAADARRRPPEPFISARGVFGGRGFDCRRTFAFIITLQSNVKNYTVLRAGSINHYTFLRFLDVLLQARFTVYATRELNVR